MSTPAPRTGVSDPGALVRQTEDEVAAQSYPPAILHTTGQDGYQPSQDRGVLADRVGDEVR